MPKATAAAGTNIIGIDTVLQDRIIRKMQEKSVISNLCTAEPKLFADEKYLVFTQEPEAEYVGESAAKSSAAFAFSPVYAKPHKVQTTVRVSQEFVWADEDGKKNILAAVLDSVGGAAARALDYGVIHGISPLTGEVSSLLDDEYLTDVVTNVATATTDPVKDLDNLPDLVIGNYDVNGIALDRAYASELRKVRVANTGMRMYPEIGLNLDPGSIDGIRSVTSDAVSGKRLAKTPTGVKAILGNWDMLKWGMVRNIALTTIPYGDPDGLGDLARYNQVAYRAEAVFSWGILDPAAFAILKAATSTGGSGSAGGAGGGTGTPGK